MTETTMSFPAADVPTAGRDGWLARLRTAFRKIDANDLRGELRHEAEVLAEKHRAHAEHHHALATMYADRLSRLSRPRVDRAALPDPLMEKQRLTAVPPSGVTW